MGSQGFASETPIRYDFDDEEMDRLAGMARLQLAEAKEDWEDAEGSGNEEPQGDNKAKIAALKKDDEDGDLALDEDLKEYDLEHYDDEPEAEATGKGMAMFSNLKNLVYHDDETGDNDPYITLPTAEEEEEEKREWQILPSDNLILATKTEEEVSTLEVYVYDDQAEASDNEDEDEDQGHHSNLYVHHDMMLPSFPLCVEWLDFRVGKGREIVSDPSAPGNFAAIGTFDPEIEIWNIDAVDSPVPDLILGQKDDDNTVMTEEEKSLKKRRRRKLLRRRSMTDIILMLFCLYLPTESTETCWFLVPLILLSSFGTSTQDNAQRIYKSTMTRYPR